MNPRPAHSRLRRLLPLAVALVIGAAGASGQGEGSCVLVPLQDVEPQSSRSL